MSNITEETKKRRAFAIISYPDAGRTALTEKFLLYGGAINLTGSVEGRKTTGHIVSDWMEIEKERGISVTSSMLQFNYEGYCINILDTPGHQDFSGDTHRTLTAANSVVMTTDTSRGVEARTVKLFRVCLLRNILIFTFINEMDREARDLFELMDEVETALGIRTCPVNWPIGCDKNFKGVYDRQTREITTFMAAVNEQKKMESAGVELGGPQLSWLIDNDCRGQLIEDIELLDGASDEFDMDLVSQGKLFPAFFGSVLTSFGVETFLEHFLSTTTSPLPRRTVDGVVDPFKEGLSAFVFKIQASMNRTHRDRIAFIRIVSDKFEASMEVNHVQGGRKIRLSQPQQMMTQDGKIVGKAYAGGTTGVFDPGIFSIGDTIYAPNKKFEFEGVPTLAPEHFTRVRQVGTMKRKQFIKDISQIAQEGAIQIFQEFNTGIKEIIAGVVGVLQFEVLTYRLENECDVEVKLEKLLYGYIRWVENEEEVDVAEIQGTSDMKRIKNLKDNPSLLFVNNWSVGTAEKRNPGLKLSEFGRN